MANDLATLKTRLAIQLRDSTNDVWTAAELGELLTDAAAQLWPRLAKPVREEEALTTGTSEYTLTTVAEISRVDLLDADDALLYALPGGTWEFWGDQETVGGTLFINSIYATTGNSLRVHGYAPYDLVTTLPPNRFVGLIQASARLEALLRMIPKRASFEKWMTLNQKENVSVNELVGMVASARAEVERLLPQAKTWRRPIPAR